MKKAAAKEWIPNSEETDAELSEGEFTDEESMRRYYVQSHIREMEIGIKKRRKSAKKAEKRMGGPPKIWSEEANRKHTQSGSSLSISTNHHHEILRSPS